jgi:hypothetical protein
MLQQMQPGTTKQAWFPWGIPPLQHLVDILSELQDEDDDEGPVPEFLREILTPFAAQQPPPESDEE